MNGRTLLSSLISLLLLVAVASANPSLPSSGSASPRFNEQQVRWCASGCYNVEIDASLSCTVCITTLWNGAVTWPSPAMSCYSPGSTAVECPMPVQPFGSPLTSVTVCGMALPGLQGQYTIPAGVCPGCPALCVRLCVGFSGCLTIRVSPAPCPVAPPPCP